MRYEVLAGQRRVVCPERERPLALAQGAYWPSSRSRARAATGRAGAMLARSHSVRVGSRRASLNLMPMLSQLVCGGQLHKAGGGSRGPPLLFRLPTTLRMFPLSEYSPAPESQAPAQSDEQGPQERSSIIRCFSSGRIPQVTSPLLPHCERLRTDTHNVNRRLLIQLQVPFLTFDWWRAQFGRQ